MKHFKMVMFREMTALLQNMPSTTKLARPLKDRKCHHYQANEIRNLGIAYNSRHTREKDTKNSCSHYHISNFTSIEFHNLCDAMILVYKILGGGFHQKRQSNYYLVRSVATKIRNNKFK